ncbi:hypothetical protein YC2023_102993 [Brassica napus]
MQCGRTACAGELHLSRSSVRTLSIRKQRMFKQAEETAKKLDLDGLVVIGGDDSNTNACLLAENFSLVVIWYKYGLEDEELLRMLLRLCPSVSVVPDQSAASSGHKLKISDVLSGGQAPGGHNVITGLLVRSV